VDGPSLLPVVDVADPVRDDAAGDGPPRLSPSGASTFRQCPRRWRLRYLVRLPDPPGEAALVGTFVHRILEELLAAEPDERSVDGARDIARRLWPEVEADPHFGSLELDPDGQRAFRWRAWRCVEGYFAVEDPTTVRVAQREQRLETEVEGVPFVGVVDRTEHTSSGLTVTDYKTGRKPPARFADERLDQVLLYAAALDSVGERPAVARLLYLGAGDLAVDADDRRVGAAAAEFAATWSAIGEARDGGDFPPRPGPLCGWCPYRAECPEGRLEVERRLGPAA
jgi:putative RecB family exonuclease